ncbi:MAG: hypothetical protein CL663_06540 [Bacteroidetes bacterium]|nr:hypothetical protein [Bacteroidota bacterium]
MEPNRILIIDRVHSVLALEFQHYGFQCLYDPEYFDKGDLSDFEEFYGIVVRSKKIGKEILLNPNNLKFIGRVGSGLENIDVDYAESLGIKCFNSPEGSRDSVGEHCMSILLSLLNKVCKSDQELKKNIWDRNNNWGTELKGKTIGIIGYGNMGSAFAEKLSGFGVNVIAYDKYKKGFSDAFVTESSMERIYAETDILSFHVPLTEETEYLLNTDYLSSFTKDIYVINSSRGKVVRTADLVQAMKEGKVKGAALDVLEYEKSAFEKLDFNTLPEDLKYLLDANNAIITPHVAGWTDESYFKLSKVLFDKVRKEFNL